MDVVHPQLGSHEEDGQAWPVLVWRSGTALRTISSAPSGGGLGHRSWVLNAQVPLSYARCDPEVHIEELAVSLGLVGHGVGMLTAACLDDVQYATDGTVAAGLDDDADDGAEVQVAATVGLAVPTWAAEATVPGARTTTVDHAGTINIVAFVPQRLGDAALVNAVGTVTEAKTQALLKAGVEATGTATDTICICCPEQGTLSAFGGPRSPWGACLARAVHTAVLAGARSWGPT